MSINTREILSGLLAVGKLGAKAEGLTSEELPRATLSIPAHLAALEPDVLLIVGGRGAGKSHLFRLLNLPGGPQAFDPTGNRSHLAQALWLRNFSTKPESSAESALRLPDELTLQQFAAGKSRTELMAFWSGLLVASVLAHPDEELRKCVAGELPASLQEALTRSPARILSWHGGLMAALEDVSAALDALDGLLTRQNRYLFATYDDLDVMAVEWNEKRALIQALLQFWLGQWRRWRRVRPKIFLRLDLFAPEFLQFPDASKLEGNRLILRWTPTQLYQLVFKGWANQNETSRRFLEECGQTFRSDRTLGWIYHTPPQDETLRFTIQRMMGEFMGKGPKKGRTFEWIANHLQDANGEIVPRSMLNLFGLAAEDERTYHRASDDLLLSPESFAVAIEQVSGRRIKELEEEYLWLASIRPRLEGRQAPMKRAEMAELLRDIHWNENALPLHREPEGVIGDLLKIGIFRLTEDGRIHVPDIYLYGFGLKRKGGIRRPRE